MLTFEEYKNHVNLTPYEHKTSYITAKRRDELCDKILKFLLMERGMIAAFNTSYEYKRGLIRSYMNERSPLPVPKEILDAQDELFWNETLKRGIVNVENISKNHRAVLWQGDITRLNADAIVNAASPDLLGCFIPSHECMDNVIHSRAGMQLRRDCAAIMSLQGESEPQGEVKVTIAYNLPSKYVFHTVGPMTVRGVTEEDRVNLRSSYLSCLELAKEMNLRSIAFCCISTGKFNFPKEEAAEIAVGTVQNWLLKNPDCDLQVIFDVYSKENEKAYSDIFKFLD